MKKQPEKSKAGRPVKNKILTINDTPERVAKTIMMKPPKKDWKYKNKTG